MILFVQAPTSSLVDSSHCCEYGGMCDLASNVCGSGSAKAFTERPTKLHGLTLENNVHSLTCHSMTMQNSASDMCVSQRGYLHELKQDLPRHLQHQDQNFL
jgi:hypothetical protein